MPKDAQSALLATKAFDEYSKWDQVNDGLLRNEESAQRTGNAGRAIFGAAGAVAGYSGAIITSPACVTLVGCALPGMSAAAGAASFLESWEATGKLFAPYEYTQGDRVLASFSSETYPGDVNPLRDYGTEAAKAAVEMVLLKGAGKYLEGTGSSILVSGVKKEGVVADGVIGASNTDKPVLPAWYREDSSAGASFNKTDGLPDGYRRVLNTRTGNAEVLAPDGQLYFDTGNGLKPKVGGNLAELAEAERQIAAAKGASGAKGVGTSLSPVYKDTDTGLNAINPITSRNRGRIQELGFDPDKGKLALHEGQAAVQLENTFGSTLKRVEPTLGSKNPDFVFVDGSYSGKTVDFMWTDSSRSAQINKFFSNNASQNKGSL